MELVDHLIIGHHKFVGFSCSLDLDWLYSSLFATEACEEAPGIRRENHLPDCMLNVVTRSIMAGLRDVAI